jgi:hypothetical protein
MMPIKRRTILFLEQGSNLIRLCLEWIKTHKWAQITINIALVTALLASIVFYVGKDWQKLQSLKLTFNGNFLVVAFGLYAVNFFTLVSAWHVLIRNFTDSADLGQNALFYSYTNLYKFLPTPAWFLASRVYLYSKTGMRRRVALTTTALETLMHMFTGLVLYCLLLIKWQNPVSWLYSLAILPVIVAINKPQWFQPRWLLGKDITSYPSKKDLTFLFFAYTLTWIVAGPFFLVIILIISDTIPMTMVELLRTWILGSLIAYLGTYTLGGIGVLREFSLTLLLSRYLYPPLALVITVLVRLVLMIGGILWALITVGFLRLKLTRLE